MLTDFYATKVGMTQAWTKSGKRLAITRCKADDLPVLSHLRSSQDNSDSTLPQKIEVGVKRKKLANMPKPQRVQMEKNGLEYGIRSAHGVAVTQNSDATDEIIAQLKPGSTIAVDQVLSIGDVVHVQGISKGRGFAGAIKRHGFHGGPKTHGQSDRARAVGSIGAGTTPGKVIKGKKMPGHYGVDTQTVKGLTIVHLDPTTKEVWLSGPVPGALFAPVRIRKTGSNKHIDLDMTASGITAIIADQATENTTETTATEK